MRSTLRRLAPGFAILGASLLAPGHLRAQSGEYVYVGNSLGGDISVIGIPSHKVVGTIPASVVGNHPDDVISSRAGDVLYRYSGCTGVTIRGAHSASRSVASLSSRSPLRIAVTGRQN